MKAEWDDAPLRVRQKKSHLPMIVSLTIVASLFGSGLYFMQGHKPSTQNSSTQKNAESEAAKPQKPQSEHYAQPRQLRDEDRAEKTPSKQSIVENRLVHRERPNEKKKENLVGTVTEWALCEGFKDGESGLSEAIRKQNCRALGTAEIWRGDASIENSENKQSVFNDNNYVPRGDVNSIRMNTLSSANSDSLKQSARQKPYVSVIKETKNRGCLAGKAGSIECRRIKSALREHYNHQCKFGTNSAKDCKLARAYTP